MKWGVIVVLIVIVAGVIFANQAGLLSVVSSQGLSGSSSTSQANQSSVTPWCQTASRTWPLSTPTAQIYQVGCYITTFQSLSVKTQDAITGQAVNGLYIRILSDGGPLNTSPVGTVLDGGQETGNAFSSTAQTYTTGQAIWIEVCSGLNGASQSTNCTSDFTAGDTVTYYPIPGGPAGQGAGWIQFASGPNNTAGLTVTLPITIVQDKYQLCGRFTNQTISCTGIGHSGAASSATEYQHSGSSPMGSSFTYSLTLSNDYSSTTFPYEAGFVSSQMIDGSPVRPLQIFVQCVLAKTGGTAGDAPGISGIPQVAVTSNGVTNGGTALYAFQVPDANTQVISGTSSQSPLVSNGAYTASFTVSQSSIVGGDTFTLTCNVYMWYSLALVQSNMGGLNLEAKTMTGSFTLTMTY